MIILILFQFSPSKVDMAKVRKTLKETKTLDELREQLVGYSKEVAAIRKFSRDREEEFKALEQEKQLKEAEATAISASSSSAAASSSALASDAEL